MKKKILAAAAAARAQLVRALVALAPFRYLIVAAIGAALLTKGAGMVYRPAGFIVPGALLLAGAIAGALRSRRE